MKEFWFTIMKYRIVEETGSLTGDKRFYVQERKKKWFGRGYYWKPVLVHGTTGGIKEFLTKKSAKYWINHRIEKVLNIYHQ